MTNTLTASEVLSKAADLIEQEGAWTQGANARDSEGNRVSARSADARCFCMAGALLHVSGEYGFSDLVMQVLPEPDEPWKDWLVAFNDNPDRTQAEVVAKLREAAERAKGGDQ